MARKILLADDSVTAQNMGRKILSDAGYEVTAVNNGSAALKKIAEIKPDLIVLDVYMPGYSGLEVCQRLKEAPETARIPVLLTVGKLEPFKPEEAQRARAEAFIVKPFEASELLSTLSKLEDKVVPRPEPSKPGRFARAIAAVEAVDRDRSEAFDSNGWKKRINFPQAPATDEKTADDSALYNAVNRDLRTVVETPAEKSASHRQEELPAQPVPVTGVDLTAVAPEGLPKDVTPEEVAAIAAAAAQIQAAEATHKSETTSDSAARTSGSETQFAVTAPEVTDIEPTLREASVDEVQNQAPTAEPVHSEEASSSHDEPVTMAAAPESLPRTSREGSRWTAVAVALGSDEAALSLADEMQKAYTALPAPEAFRDSAQAAPEVQGIPAENPTSADFIAESSSAPTAEYNPQESSLSASETLPAEPDVQTEASEASVPESHLVSFGETDTTPSPDTNAETSLAENKDARNGTEESRDTEDAGKDEPGFARAAVASSEGSSFTAYSRIQEQAPTDDAFRTGTEPNVDAETVTAAAAWANWNQTREVQNAPEIAGAQPLQDASTQIPEAQLSPDSTSRAVAAGAEQITQESATPSSDEAKDVASIVESVLADLRPRLVEEISRKMGQKK